MNAVLLPFLLPYHVSSARETATTLDLSSSG